MDFSGSQPNGTILDPNHGTGSSQERDHWCVFDWHVTFRSSVQAQAGYLFLLLKIACYSLSEHLNSLGGQFWGRAALAPVILFRIRALPIAREVD